MGDLKTKAFKTPQGQDPCKDHEAIMKSPDDL